MRHLRPKPIPCTLHTVVEGGWNGQPLVHPYRCARCGRCFVCQHSQWGPDNCLWVCFDKARIRSTPNPGTPAEY